ncbi:MAG: hypothetical protein ACI4C1_10960, partial [Lachnospiraceae bacterium]
DQSCPGAEPSVSGRQHVASEISNKDFEIDETKITEDENYVLFPSIGKCEISPADRNRMMEECYRMLIDGKMYCAMAYLNGAAQINRYFEAASQQLAYALNDPMKVCHYRSDEIFSVYAENIDDASEYYKVAAVLRTYFMNHIQHDYSADYLFNSVNQSAILEDNSDLSQILYKLLKFKEEIEKGIDAYADYRSKTQAEWEKKLTVVRECAENAYEHFILRHRSEKTSNRRFVIAKNMLLKQGSEMATMLKTVAENNTDKMQEICEMLQVFFIKEGENIAITNVDNTKINEFIDSYWEKAMSEMHTVKVTSDLMSDLRSNLYNIIMKIVKITCNWVEIFDSNHIPKNDKGMERYKQERDTLIEQMNNSVENLENLFVEVKEEHLAWAAGIRVLIATLKELIHRLEGDYSEESYNYFYIDFLKGGYIQLTEDYTPDFRAMFLDIEGFTFFDRIKKHCESRVDEIVHFEKRMEEIFNEYGDDYGCAALIEEYSKQVEGISLLHDKYDLNESLRFAQNDAAQRLSQFVEDLELAQSYGQFDNSQEDKKEKILENVNEWYLYCTQTRNLGFFKKILKEYKNKIREEAKNRGSVLVGELNRFKKNNETLLDDEKIVEMLEKIQKMLEIQNYTVAEDLLNRIVNNDLEDSFDFFGVDFLNDFYDKYDYFYRKVADSSMSMNTLLLNVNSRNKDARGGKRLVENWPKNGGHLGEQKLKFLLTDLGFDVSQVQEQEKFNNRIENYNVTLKNPENGRKSNFKHPIAAFGSGAIQNAFRIICLYGKFDADRLIDVENNMGSAKHTIVLLDYALSQPERKRLARKIKQVGGHKIFAVLDRVMLMYLADNYSETAINRMLMMLMMPFAYYQPYIEGSGVVMPPEMFMGRKEELEQIESSTGANIVYGGRQLGKSALLRMAKNNINGNENHDRAVLIDIKDKNYQEAARKIGHTLYDEGILTEEIETEDWNELARAIKKRLLSKTEERIPYLLLLLDEADHFIASCEPINYQPFDALKDIQSVGSDRFKFVVAGLRNIVRFNKEVALGRNSVLTHLKAITVTPFKVKEARELLEIPLYYLGFRLQQERDSLISLILASTNYFPGLIQLYCAKLVEAMKKNDYAGYDEGSTPPYEIQVNHIKKVLADVEFRKQIQEKFDITLEVDEDHYYYIIALLLARLYHTYGSEEGYSPEDIKQEADNYEIPCMQSMSVENIAALMEELRELNVLRVTSKNHYLYYRYSFFQMMGSVEEVDEKILKYMDAGQEPS